MALQKKDLKNSLLRIEFRIFGYYVKFIAKKA
ncbi:hypothetical protein ARAQ110984_05240 [Arcobacter aquimarinus]